MATKDLNNIKSASYNKEELLRALRTGVMAELDAVNQYSIMAEAATDESVKKIITDIMQEEQVHVGEFMKLIEKINSPEIAQYKEGELEAAEKMADGLPGVAFPPKPAICDPIANPNFFKKKANTKITFVAEPPEQQPNNQTPTEQEPPEEEEPEEETPEESPEEEEGEEEEEPIEQNTSFSIEQLNKELGDLLEETDEEE